MFLCRLLYRPICMSAEEIHGEWQWVSKHYNKEKGIN